MWVGLLFSVMSMSAYLQQQNNEVLGFTSVDSNNMMETYRNLTIQCLVAGDYIRPSRYTIETLFLHFALEQNVSLDTHLGNWILIGVIVRIAFRMGLHRDPSHWPNIRPLQAELRRRVWLALYQMDFFTSTQVGLPRIIKDAQCDTRPPLSLLDTDIGLEHEDYPPERPSTEPTPLSHLIHRYSIIKVTAEIYDINEAETPSPVTTSLLSTKIDKAVASMPTWLRHKPLESSIADNPLTILNRINLDILIQKATYLLHRWSFMKVPPTREEEGTKSNELCIEAALTILDHQRKINEEIKPGGLMFAIRWRVIHALNHEFLQATMMLCFALSRLTDGGDSITTNSYVMHRQKDIIDALVVSKGIWEEIADRSVEAQRAAKTINSVLGKYMEDAGFPATTSPNGEKDVLPRCSMLLLMSLLCFLGFFEQMPEVASQEFLGGFDIGDDLALDPSFLQMYNDTTFGDILDDFIAEQS